MGTEEFIYWRFIAQSTTQGHLRALKNKEEWKLLQCLTYLEKVTLKTAQGIQ